MHPTTLPGRAYVSVASDRISRLLYHFRAREITPLANMVLTGQTTTFTRATAGIAIDANGRIRTPVHSQPRIEMYDFNGDGIRETPALLSEVQVTQILANPQTPASWADSGTPVLTTGQADPWGGTAGILIEDNDAGASEGKSQAVTFTGDGTKTVMFALRAGTASVVRAKVFDGTAGADRHMVTVTWNGGTTAPTIATAGGAGSIYAPVGVVDRDGTLWWLIAFSADGVIAANSNILQVLAGTNVAGVGTFYLAGANAWDNTLPASWLATAATVRNADALISTIAFDSFRTDNDDVTVYARIARPLHSDASGTTGHNPGVFSISSANPCLKVEFGNSARVLVAKVQTGTVDVQVTASIPTTAAIEICAQFSDLVIGGKVKMDAGSGFGAISTSATPFAALGNTNLQVAAGASQLRSGLADLKIARGLYTMQEMREAF